MDTVYDDYVRLKGWRFATGECPPGEAAYFAAELGRHGFCCEGRSILEIGFGSGTFLRFARDNGADVVGVEIQEELLEAARAEGYAVFGSVDKVIETYPDRCFDLVAAFDVLEHLQPEESVAILRKLRRLIQSGTGLLIARFPNGDSPFGLPLQNGDYTHSVALGAGIVEQILGRSGWRINYLGEPALVLSTPGSWLFQAPRHAARRFVERLILTFYFGRGGPSTLFYNYVLAATGTPGTDAVTGDTLP